MKRSTKAILISVAGLLVVGGALAALKGGQISAMIKAGESFRPPPEAVTTSTVVADIWERSLSAVGSVVAVRGVMLAAEMPGTVRSITFDSGQTVKEGDILVRLDAGVEQAQLASARAAAELAGTDFERTNELAKQNATPRAQLDTARSRADQSRATAQSLGAMMSKRVLRAPFSGRLGIREVNLGQVVSPGTPFVSLFVLDPVFVDFYLPQRVIGTIEVGQEVIVRTDTFEDITFAGTIDAIDAGVDEVTRNIKIRALVPNPRERLRPGMFANVSVILPTEDRVLIIPETAVLPAPFGDSVFVVEKQETPDGQSGLIARHQFVRLGERRGDLVAVLSGLKAGEVVVSTGAFKLRNNVGVVVKNELAPKSSATPSPPES